MSISIGSGSIIILEQLKANCLKETLDERFEFKELLKTTNSIERYIIAKIFCQIPWNIGSLHVLSILQEIRILTASEFILSLDSNEQVQLILNDFLEAEFEVLADLFIKASYDSINSVKLNSYLDECFLSLFTDLLKNSGLNDLNYMKALKKYLPGEILSKFTYKHVDTILELHKSNIKAAFSNFSDWINEGVDTLNFTKIFQQNLVRDMEEDVLKYLFKTSTRENFKEWKFYLILTQTIASSCKPDTTAFIRKYLKSRVPEIAALPNKHLVLHMVLTARAATATTVDLEKNIDAYAHWYRQNIAEMKFVLKPDEFQNICSVLEQCIAYEMEELYLDIHATISISPPVLCGKMVQNYKNGCKYRLSQIKNKKIHGLELGDESILLDSD